jgi:hypothetical protein
LDWLHDACPFEIDVTLDPFRDDQFAKIVFRIETLDEQRRPKLFSGAASPTSVFHKGPQNNRDWALAAELSPPRSKEP